MVINYMPKYKKQRKVSFLNETLPFVNITSLGLSSRKSREPLYVDSGKNWPPCIFASLFYNQAYFQNFNVAFYIKWR